MAKNIRKVLSVLTMIALLATTLFAGMAVAEDNAVVARYLVTSDTHNFNGTLQNAIQATYDYAQTQDYKGFDAIAVVGDISNNGTDTEFTNFRTAVDQKLAELYTEDAPRLIVTMGNHDYGNKSNSDDVNAAYRASFENIVGCAPNAVYDINGVKFIGISMPSHVNKVMDFEWLDAQLAAATAENPNAVINVLTHIPMVDTFFGSEKEYGNGITYQNDQLKAVLAKYPNAILWSGHSHAYIGNERSLYQDESGFCAINTGSFSTAGAYYDTTAVNGTVGSEKIHAFYIVEAYANGDSRVRRYDLKNGQFFAKDWYIGADYDNTLAGRAATTETPYFAEGSQLTVEGGVEGTLVYLPDAMDDENVELYKLTVTDGVNTIESTSMRHYFYTVVDPVQLFSVKGLEPNTAYTAKVTAVDFFGAESEALTAQFTTGEYVEGLDTLYSGAINAENWTGSVSQIDEEHGFYNKHDGNSYMITLKNTIDLGDKFEVAADFWRNEINLADSSYSVIQVGELSLAMRRMGDCNSIAICYGYNAASTTNPFDSDYVIARFDAPNTSSTEEYRMLFDNGNVTVYRSGAIVLTAEIDEYDFSSASVKLKLNERYVVNAYGAQFKTFTLRAVTPKNASYTFIDNGFDTENWIVNAEGGNVTDGQLNLGSVGTSSNIVAKEKIDLGNSFTAKFSYLRRKYNPNVNNFSFAQFGDIGILIKNNYADGSSSLSLCYGFDATANKATAPTEEQILATSANLGSPDSTHTVALDYNNGMIKVIRDGSVVITYDASTLGLDFSETQVAFQMYETWVTTNNGYSYIKGYTVDRSFTVDELNAALDALVVDGKVVATDEEITTAEAMYGALAHYQLGLVENAENLALAIEARDRIAGDVNGDKKITSSDYSALVLALLGYSNEYTDKALDVDASGTVDSADSLALMQHMLGIATLA